VPVSGEVAVIDGIMEEANSANRMKSSSTFGMLSTATIQSAIGSNTNIPRYLQVSMRLYF